MTDKSIEADAARFRWLLDGHGYFMEEAMLCGAPPTTEIDKDSARAMIDEAMQPTTIREVVDALKDMTDLVVRSGVDAPQAIAGARAIIARLGR